MCGQPFSLLLCSGGIEVTFKQLFQRRNLLKFGVVLPKYLLIFIIQPITFVLIKQLHGLCSELAVGLCMHISLSLICFLPFIFSLLYICNCLFTTVTKFNYSSG